MNATVALPPWRLQPFTFRKWLGATLASHYKGVRRRETFFKVKLASWRPKFDYGILLVHYVKKQHMVAECPLANIAPSINCIQPRRAPHPKLTETEEWDVNNECGL